MSKIICDVCGTAYPDSADQCPICGTAKTEVTPTAAAEGAQTGYAYVKGGRFSQNNVRKHNSGERELPRTTEEEKPARKPRNEHKEEKPAPVRKPRAAENKENEEPSNLGLIIIVVILLVAILAVCAYIGICAYNKYADRDLSAGNNSTSSTDGGQNGVTVPCAGVAIEGPDSYTFSGLNESYMLSVTCNPADTTDELKWEYDEDVVSLEKVGNYWYLAPVAPGETTVKVTCGDYSASIAISCDFVGRIPCTGITIDGPATHTFLASNETYNLTVNCAPADTNDALEWTYDEAVVSVTKNEDGTWCVAPVAPGQTTVTVTCGDQTASIDVVCDFVVKPNFVLTWACGTDITLTGYGTSWVIYNGSMDVAEITFTSSNEEVATVEGNRVYIWKNGSATITATYEDQRITMIVRAAKVVPPAEGAPVCYIYSQYGKIQGECTIRVDASLTLTLRDENGKKLEGVVFSVDNEEYLTLTDNGKITAVAPVHGGTYVNAEYEGNTYKVLIRVYEAETEE